MDTSPSPKPPQDLGKTIIPETQRVINSQPRQLLTLSFFFLLLPSAATTAFLILRYPLLNDAVFEYLLSMTKIFPEGDRSQDHHDHTPSLPTTLFLALCLYIFNLVSSSCAVGSITHTVFHGFKGDQQKVSLKSAMSSLASSFFPLLATNLLLQALTLAIAVTTFAAALLLAMLLGFHNIDVYSLNFFLFSMLTLLVLMSVVTYLQADWSLALAITSLEPNNWGFESVRLSKILISMKGKRARDIAFSMSYIFGVSQAFSLLIICYSSLIMRLDQGFRNDDDDEWNFLSLALATQILVVSIFQSSFQLNHIAVNSLLYVHCKASSTDEREDEQYGCVSHTKYVMVPIDDEKEVFDQRVISVV